MMREFWERYQKGIIVVVGILLFMTAGYIATSFPQGAKKPSVIDKAVSQTEPEPKTAEPEVSASVPAAGLPGEWVLYITGAVRRPGVYALPAGSRLIQLVEAAGGLNMIADPAAVNLAAFLEDGMHVHVPDKGDKQQTYSAYVGVSSYVAARTEPGPPAANSSAGGLLKSGSPQSGLPLDVNRATAEELTALKGIGPALAGRIVEYRLKNGRFNEINDLLRVKGIGRKTLERFRDAVVIRP